MATNTNDLSAPARPDAGLAPVPLRAHAAPTPRAPELLSPAGDWDCAKAAVENGADAIYFGLDRFNARIRAQNFTQTDLPALMEFLHKRGVRGYVSFNTLIFENELEEARNSLKTIIAAGVDAAIVQDVGICRMIREISPDFPIHASTQMTITSLAGVDFARELGCSLVVLARECSLTEMERIQARQGAAATLEAPQPVLPIEVFVHGALCVAYSGQCLTSEALGGRSANRGECAQACRMPYELVSDGQTLPLGDRRYLLSPQDLAGIELLPELLRVGISSLKIEGRLKSPEYVANITRIYREAIDIAARVGPAVLSGPHTRADAQDGAVGTPRPTHREVGPAVPSGPQTRLNAQDGAVGTPRPTHREVGPAVPSGPQTRLNDQDGALGQPRPTAGKPLDVRPYQYDLEMAFSRGLYTGWLRGTNNQELVHGRFGKKRGVYLGQVGRIQGGTVFLRLEAPLKPGDGIVFDAGRPDQDEEGGRIYSVDKRGAEAQLGFGHGDIDFSRVRPGDRLWKTSDPELDKRLRQSFAGDQPRFQRAVDIEAHGRVGAPLTLIVRDELGHVVRVESAMPLAAAEKQPLTTERLREQLGRLGGTAFRLGGFQNQIEGQAMLPVSELNRLRREAVTGLDRLRALPLRWSLNPPSTKPADLVTSRETAAPTAQARSAPELIALVRQTAQLDAALAAGVRTVYCEFEDPKLYRAAIVRFREWQQTPGGKAGPTPSAIFVAPPRITKPGEEWILNQVRSCDADGWLVRNYDQLAFFSGARCIGDYSLNVANALAADYFKTRYNLERLTASYDLNIIQLEALLQSGPPEWFDITIHQHMPMFHMEHCLFCAFLSKGKDYRDCGRPCDHHQLELRDRVGAEHPVKVDAGCRNTVFNALAQTGAEYAERLVSLGARHFRVEFLNETPPQVTQTLQMYAQLLRGEISGVELWRRLKLRRQLGVTRGPMEKPDYTRSAI